MRRKGKSVSIEWLQINFLKEERARGKKTSRHESITRFTVGRCKTKIDLFADLSVGQT